MGRMRTGVVAVTAILLGAALAGSASAVVTCEAVGEAYAIGNGQFEYCTSYGTPMATQTYYDVILIKAGDLCLVW